MKRAYSHIYFPLIVIALIASGCESGGGGGAPQASGPATPGPACNGYGGGSFAAPSSSGSPSMSVTVGGSGLCANNVNIPCTSVTICEPGTNNCQTISNILVDTGSFGLRVFSQAMSQSLCTGLTPLHDGSGNPIGECAQFGIGSDWGSVMQADVQLGGLPVVRTSIQVINSSFSLVPSSCGSVDSSPSQAGFNGILGVGLYPQDCGEYCNDYSNMDIYFSCSGGNCTSVTMPYASQVQNPVTLLASSYSNGLSLTLPAVGVNGSNSVTGTMTFGIGNPGGSPKVFAATELVAGNLFPNITTSLYSEALTESFLDSGSNALYFPPPSGGGVPGPALTNCSGFFCPASPVTFSATMTSGATSSGALSFEIINANTLMAPNLVFNDIGANASATGLNSSFDWGLPFFLGRTVYIGIQNEASSLGTGPYWAF